MPLPIEAVFLLDILVGHFGEAVRKDRLVAVSDAIDRSAETA